MSRKHKNKKSHTVRPISIGEADALTRGKMIYQFSFLYDQDYNIIGRSLIFMENFYETGQLEEQTKRWSLLFYDDGRLMIHEW